LWKAWSETLVGMQKNPLHFSVRIEEGIPAAKEALESPIVEPPIPTPETSLSTANEPLAARATRPPVSE
jgi:hypothetical protein